MRRSSSSGQIARAYAFPRTESRRRGSAVVAAATLAALGTAHVAISLSRGSCSPGAGGHPFDALPEARGGASGSSTIPSSRLHRTAAAAVSSVPPTVAVGFADRLQQERAEAEHAFNEYIAHEVRNPLSVAIMGTDSLIEDMGATRLA